MSDREQAKMFILEVARRLFDTDNSVKKDFEQTFSKVTAYRPRFLNDNEFNGTSVKRSELFETNNDNKIILKILKLAHSLLQSYSYNNLVVEKDCVKMTATQVGRGEFSIIIRLIDFRENLQVIVHTVSNKN